MSGTPWQVQDLDFDAVFTKPFPLLDLVESVEKLTTVPLKTAMSA
jgi:hypothetical protein